MSRSAWVGLLISLVLIAGIASSWVAAWYALLVASLLVYAVAAFRKPTRLLSATRRLSATHIDIGSEVTVWIGLRWSGMRGAGWVLARDMPSSALKALDAPGRLFVSGVGGSLALTYRAEGRLRGYHSVGPMSVSCGDFFGATRIESGRERVDHVTVYPRVLPVPRVRLPSNRPIGEVAGGHRAFEDATRLVGVRPYIAGDSLRRIHWHATARAGSLQSKVFEPSCSTEVNMVLNLHTADCHSSDDVESACTAAASLVTELLQDRQSVGLRTNGADARRLANGLTGRSAQPSASRPEKGIAHKARLLEVLACVQPSDAEPLSAFLTRIHSDLPWSATVLVVTCGLESDAVEAIRHLSRSGFAAAVLIVGSDDHARTGAQRVLGLNIPCAWAHSEEALATLEFRRPDRR